MELFFIVVCRVVWVGFVCIDLSILVVGGFSHLPGTCCYAMLLLLLLFWVLYS